MTVILFLSLFSKDLQRKRTPNDFIVYFSQPCFGVFEFKYFIYGFLLLMNPEDEVSKRFIFILLVSQARKPFQITRYVKGNKITSNPKVGLCDKEATL